eukprot:458770-Pyramimonas_sp.AAC.1
MCIRDSLPDALEDDVLERGGARGPALVRPAQVRARVAVEAAAVCVDGEHAIPAGVGEVERAGQ